MITSLLILNTILFDFNGWYQLSHPVDNYLAVLWIQFHAVTFAVKLLCCDHCCAAAKKRVITIAIMVSHSSCHTFNRLLSAVPCFALLWFVYLPYGCLLPISSPVAFVPLFHGIPAWFMLPVIIAPAY